ncbi:hypothetical protein ACFP1Z_16730 [Streptomyces gamaensis]|uniref:Uncharacterized protein n=1 Tax=Streptomyces gamaensis TaxID=1763542 RepID=A0ABW0Z2X2_9ACTN
MDTPRPRIPRLPDGEPYFTTNSCTGCGADVHGIHGRWSCPHCGACSQYLEPPEGWATEITDEELATNMIGHDPR